MDWIRFVVENAESHLFFLLLDKLLVRAHCRLREWK